MIKTILLFILSIYAGEIRQITVPANTLVIIIKCDQLNDHGNFARCMLGPAYRCTVALWSTQDQWRTLVCSGILPRCMYFDEDGNGTVDLRDFAIKVTSP